MDRYKSGFQWGAKQNTDGVKVVILAAGLGTRLRPLTNKTPKCLVQIEGRPIFDYIYFNLNKTKPREIAVNVHHLPLKVINHINKKDKIYISVENTLLGTAGALKKLEGWLSDPFIVCNGDTLTNLDIEEMLQAHIRSECKATVYTKDNLIHNGGTFIFNKSVLQQIPKDSFYSIDKDLLPNLIKTAIVSQYDELDSWYFDIGIKPKLEKARKFIANLKEKTLYA